jgi:hypothetical protein
LVIFKNDGLTKKLSALVFQLSAQTVIFDKLILYMLKKILYMVALLPLAAFAQKPAPNPLLIYTNAPIHFEQVDVAIVKDAVAQVIKKCDAGVKALIAIPAGKQTVANTLMKFDDINYELSSVSGKVGVISSTYEDDKIRDEATAQNEKLSGYNSDLYLNVSYITL